MEQDCGLEADQLSPTYAAIDLQMWDKYTSKLQALWLCINKIIVKIDQQSASCLWKYHIFTESTDKKHFK